MTGSELIAKFELYVDDGTELSEQEELDLLNKVYNDVCTERPWLFSTKENSEAISGTEVDLPDDFMEMLISTDLYRPAGIVWVDNSYYTIVNYSERKERNDGVCWLDIARNKLVFNQSVSGTLTYDYTFFPVLLTLTTSPVFPASFQAVLYHLMAADDYMIQQFDKAKSYAPENQKKADYWFEKLRLWDANLKINSQHG